jgi:hypothetical protein
MRDIICSGCSFTNFRTLQNKSILNGYIPPIKDNFINGSYPEAIHRNYGNNVYNVGLLGNSVSTSVLSAISVASRLLKEGNNNFSIILQSTDFERQHLYFSNDVKEIKKIKKNTWPINNNYLLNNDSSGFIQLGKLQLVTKNYSDCDVLSEIANVYSKHIYSNENCTINSLTHLLLLQNFCKVHNIPYKIFKMMDLFSSPIFPTFNINNKNKEIYFKTFFIDKKLPKKKPLGYVKSDEYIYDLFKMLDLDNMWFYSDENVKYGGFFEWIYKNNEYKEGDMDYIALYKEDVVDDVDKAMSVSDDIHRNSINSAKDKMKIHLFNETAHPTYYYWEKFVKEVMVNWNLF